jgi:hypothetical protein
MRQLFIDSRDRVSGTPCDFTIQLPQTLVIEGGNHKFRVDNLRIPMTIPTIQTGVNDTIKVAVTQNNTTTNYTVTIPGGNYDGVTLASTLNYLLNATQSQWTVGYDTANIRLNIACAATFKVVGGTYAAQIMQYSYQNTTNAYQFNYVSMVSVDQIYLCSQQFANLDTYGPKGTNDALAVCVVTGIYGSVTDVGMPTDAWVDMPNLTTQTLSFQLKDRDGNILNIIPDFSFVLLID